mmetsp:Transcript_59345/g.158929  ORF Transcript_59345/g.158929 Transcript_59345/m.158929 type:complete len:107 (-) Transcript_59345:1138-1458(-)
MYFGTQDIDMRWWQLGKSLVENLFQDRDSFVVTPGQTKNDTEAIATCCDLRMTFPETSFHVPQNGGSLVSCLFSLSGSSHGKCSVQLVSEDTCWVVFCTGAYSFTV